MDHDVAKFKVGSTTFAVQRLRQEMGAKPSGGGLVYLNLTKPVGARKNALDFLLSCFYVEHTARQWREAH